MSSALGVLDVFASDRGRSVLRIPLAERRRELESIPWIEQATLRRVLPSTIEVEIVERTPIAFLRQARDMAFCGCARRDPRGFSQGNFRFPVVTGISADMSPEEREKRMQLFAGFTQQVASARAGAMEQVSEVDLSDAHDLRATLTGLQTVSAGGTSSETWGQGDAPVLVNFGDGDFEGKYQT